MLPPAHNELQQRFRGPNRTSFKLFICPQCGCDRTRIGEACGLDEDVVEHRLLQHEALERVDKVVLHAAAEAAVGELHPLVHMLFASDFILQECLFDASLVPNLVQDDSNPEAVVLRENVVYQRGLASTCTE